MKIPKAIRSEIEKEIIDYLESKGTIITSPTFKNCSKVIKMRYMKMNKDGSSFVRRLSFDFKRKRNLDPKPQKNLKFFDEIFSIQVKLDNSKSFTSSTYPNKNPNFKLPKYAKNWIKELILKYLRNWYKVEGFVVCSPVFKFVRNTVNIKFLDDKLREKKMKFRFIKSNSKVLWPTSKIERIVQLVDVQRGLLRYELSYYRKA